MGGERKVTLTAVVDHDAGAVHFHHQGYDGLEVVGLAAARQARQEENDGGFPPLVQPFQGEHATIGEVQQLASVRQRGQPFLRGRNENIVRPLDM